MSLGIYAQMVRGARHVRCWTTNSYARPHYTVKYACYMQARFSREESGYGFHEYAGRFMDKAGRLAAIAAGRKYRQAVRGN